MSYVEGTTVPQLLQLLVEFKSPDVAATAVAALDKALDGCGAFEFKEDGDTVKGQIGKVSLPDVAGADEQINYQMTIRSEGFGLAAGILVVSKGDYATMLALVDLGSFDTDQLVELGELARGKLGSDQAPADQSTTSTTAVSTDPATAPSLAISGTVTIPEGEEGELSVVLTGILDEDGSSVPVVVRNRTADTVYSLEVSGTARSSDGALRGVRVVGRVVRPSGCRAWRVGVWVRLLRGQRAHRCRLRSHRDGGCGCGILRGRRHDRRAQRRTGRVRPDCGGHRRKRDQRRDQLRDRERDVLQRGRDGAAVDEPFLPRLGLGPS